ncbi:MAG: hypothetical protein V8S58_14380 [Lachnospiraceae bacterium]
MKLTKKVTAMAMASCMILSMTACGGSKPAETTAAFPEPLLGSKRGRDHRSR